MKLVLINNLRHQLISKFSWHEINRFLENSSKKGDLIDEKYEFWVVTQTDLLKTHPGDLPNMDKSILYIFETH